MKIAPSWRQALTGLTTAALLFLWLDRGEPGAVPTEESAYNSLSIAPLLPLPEEPFSIQMPQAVSGRSEVVFALFVDGLSYSHFSDAIEGGRMPHLSRMLSEKPSVRLEAMGTFPTSTAPAVPELLSGAWAHHQEEAPDKIHSFDRRSGRLLRYEVEEQAWDGSLPTLFDVVTAHGGESLSYFEGYYPGASLNVHEEMIYLLGVLEEKTRAARLLDYDRRLVADIGARLSNAERAPNLIFVRFGGIDTAGHYSGPSSREYRHAIRALDTRLGELFEQLRLATLPDGSTLYERAHFALFSDHGMADTEHHLDLDAVLRGLGFNPWPTSDPRSVIATYVDSKGAIDHDSIAVPGGSNLASVYLRARLNGALLPWSKERVEGDLRDLPTERGRVDLVGALAETPGVDWVIYPEGEDTLHLTRDAPSARVLRRFAPDGGWRLAYLPEDPADDPFGYCGADPGLCCLGEPADSCFLDEATWASRTAAMEVPLAPFFLWKAFSGDRAVRQDMLITSARGYGFMKEVRGDHGALWPELIRVPMIFAGDRVNPAAKLEHPRLIDIMPTVLSLMGIPEPPVRRDGRALPIFVTGEATSILQKP